MLPCTLRLGEQTPSDDPLSLDRPAHWRARAASNGDIHLRSDVLIIIAAGLLAPTSAEDGVRILGHSTSGSPNSCIILL